MEEGCQLRSVVISDIVNKEARLGLADFAFNYPGPPLRNFTLRDTLYQRRDR